MPHPFVKWAGGKRNLLPTLMQHLPADFMEHPDITYIEPFVGGGAMLFRMLERFPNIHRAIINDINPALINCYQTIQNQHQELIDELLQIEHEYYAIPNIDAQRAYYYALREEYNAIPVNERNTIRAAALFIALNRTCFNGLYRENRHGEFNVPFGRYVHPTICDHPLIIEDHMALQHVEICLGDYQQVFQLIDDTAYNFFYFDPPYRPLLGANNFKEYTMNVFGDAEQEQLKAFCDMVHEHHGQFMLSNSDSEIEPGRNYFEELYEDYHFDRVFAPRVINAIAVRRQAAREVLIKNYD